MDQHELAQELYEDNRSVLGDGDFTWNVSWDEAGEIIGRENARQYAWEDAWQDDLSAYRADSEITAIRANKPPEVSGVSGGIAISALGALGSPATIFVLGLGLLVLVGGGYVLYKLSSDDAQTSSNETSGNSVAPSVNERLDGFDAKIADIKRQQNETKAILACMERQVAELKFRRVLNETKAILARLEQPKVA